MSLLADDDSDDQTKHLKFESFVTDLLAGSLNNISIGDHLLMSSHKKQTSDRDLSSIAKLRQDDHDVMSPALMQMEQEPYQIDFDIVP